MEMQVFPWVLAGLVGLFGCDGKGFRVAEEGRVVADVVLPAHATEVERYAAEELAYHVGKAFGAEPATVTEDKFDPAAHLCHFFVGATEAAKRAGLRDKPFVHEERRLKTMGNALFLLGGDEEQKKKPLASWAVSIAPATSLGTLYAVYDFLENEMDVKWIWPGKTGEVIPRRTALACAPIDRGGVEPLVARVWSMMRIGPDSGLGFSSKETHRKYYVDRDVFLLRHRVGKRARFRSGHSFNTYWKRFGKTHPEYFNQLPNGKRERIYTRGWGEHAMCVSEPALWKQIVDDWLSSRKREVKPGDPFAPLPWVQCYENDFSGCCLCDRCRAWDAPDPRFALNPYWNGTAAKTWAAQGADGKLSMGEDFRNYRLSDTRWYAYTKPGTRPPPSPSLSDRYAKFYNSVLKEARTRDPDARVIAYAYVNYREPPKETAVDPGVAIEYVARSYFPYDEEESRTFRSEWLGWRKAGARDLVHRPNFTHALGNFPIDQSRRMVEDFAFAYTNGMFACAFDSLMESFSTLAMPNYAMTRMMREPLRGYDAARADMVAAFGKAGPAMSRYFDHVENFTTNWTYDAFMKVRCDNPMSGGHPGGGFDRLPWIAGDFLSDGYLATSDALLEEARRAAGEDAEVLARIEYLRKGLRHVRLIRATAIAQKAARADKTNAAKQAAFERAFADLLAFRRETEGDGVDNYERDARLERMYENWPHKPLHAVKK